MFKLQRSTHLVRESILANRIWPISRLDNPLGVKEIPKTEFHRRHPPWRSQRFNERSYGDNLRPETTVLRRNLAQKFSQNRLTRSWWLDLATTAPGRSAVRCPPFAQGGHHDFPAGRPVASGHLRSQDGRALGDSRRVQTHSHQRPGHPDLRAP